MREKFPGFYRPTKEEFDELWREALFVLDANVLLNLYRYPETAREELLTILEQVSGRLWIPFHAALEFQRNRPAVLADQKGRFGDVRKIIGDALSTLEGDLGKLQLGKRHSVIDTDPLVKTIKRSIDRFWVELDELEKKQSGIHSEEPLRRRIDELLGARVGDSPTDQEAVDRICQEGKKRYEHKVPPGYMDLKKEGGGASVYSYGGIMYLSEFGDLILWKQILERAKDPGTKSLIFITDDEKEDWWWIVESQGKKKLGPRPELIDEIQRVSNLNGFYMYNSGQFLQHAKDHLRSQVSEESIEQVREVARSNMLRNKRFTEGRWLSFSRVKEVISEWLRKRYADSIVLHVESGGGVDFVVDSRRARGDIGLKGVKVIYVASAELLRDSFKMIRHFAEEFTDENPFSEFEVIAVGAPGLGVPEFSEIEAALSELLPDGISVVLGGTILNRENEREFVEFSRKDINERS